MKEDKQAIAMTKFEIGMKMIRDGNKLIAEATELMGGEEAAWELHKEYLQVRVSQH